MAYKYTVDYRGYLLEIQVYDSTRTVVEGIAFSRDLEIIDYIFKFDNKPTADEMKRYHGTICVESLLEVLAENALDEKDLLKN